MSKQPLYARQTAPVSSSNSPCFIINQPLFDHLAGAVCITGDKSLGLNY